MIINDCMKHDPFQTEYKGRNGILDKSLTFISDREKILQLNMDFVLFEAGSSVFFVI